jgi:excisionase family DNA binding protein
MTTIDVLLTPAEAAELLRINRRTLRRWTTEGILPAVKIVAATRYSNAVVSQLIRGTNDAN